jgi:hypothetical protein
MIKWLQGERDAAVAGLKAMNKLIEFEKQDMGNGDRSVTEAVGRHRLIGDRSVVKGRSSDDLRNKGARPKQRSSL